MLPNSNEGRIVAEMSGALDRVQAMFTDALVDASGNYARWQKKNAREGVRYSLKSDRNYFVEDKYFKSQMARWGDLKHGSYVRVGDIGDSYPLHMVGMPSGVLRYDVDKLKRNMLDHGDYLNIELLKAIPDIIADPMAISEYSQEKTVSVFGNIFVGNSPMMVGVTISKDRAGNDISKVRTYNTRRDVGKLITDESILYLNEDKKRTQEWFQACGIQVPLGGTKFGFIRSISQNTDSVKRKFSERDEEADFSSRTLLADALADASGNYANGQKNNAEGVVRYSERDYDYSKPFSEQIDDYLSGNFPQRDTLIVGETPKILQKVGFNALPMTMNQTHVDYALNGSKNAEHHIGVTMLKQLPMLLQSPVAVIVSQSHPSISVVVIVSMQHNGDQVIAPVYLDGTGRQNGVSIDSNAITSIHGRSNAITGLLKNALDREANGSIGVYYADKAKTASLLTTAGVTMPQGLSLGDGFIHSIRENASPVKPKIQNVTESQQFKRWFGDWQNHSEKASKVVNDDGTPKVMYHGTRAENGEFWEFDYNKAKKKGGLGFKALGQGNYFTSQKLDGTEMFGSRVIEAYLSIKKPFTVETGAGFDFRKQVSEVLGINASQMTYPAIQNAMREQGYDGVMNEEKPNQKPKYKFSYERLSTYIPKELHNSQVEEFVIEALKYYTSRRRKGKQGEPAGKGSAVAS